MFDQVIWEPFLEWRANTNVSSLLLPEVRHHYTPTFGALTVAPMHELDNIYKKLRSLGRGGTPRERALLLWDLVTQHVHNARYCCDTRVPPG